MCGAGMVKLLHVEHSCVVLEWLKCCIWNIAVCGAGMVKVLHVEHSCVWCWNWNTSENISEMSWKVLKCAREE